MMNRHGYPGFANYGHKHEALERGWADLAPGVRAFTGYSSSNIGVIASKNGYILVDTGDDLDGAAAVLREIKIFAPGALQGIILTHGHRDHRAGAEVFVEGHTNIRVWGHVDFEAEQKAAKGLEDIGALRAGKHFGMGIPDEDYPGNSILPRFSGGKSGPLISPNIFVADATTPITIDGVNIELHALPGETTDHLVVWLPEQRVLFTGDNVYSAFPNVYPVRGSVYRDVEQWGRTVRRLMEFNPAGIMFGHCHSPAPGEIMPLLGNYAAALEYVYAATIKGMNEGQTPDELAASVRLPEDLCAQAYLGEFYGAVSWAVRAIYAHKLGWFDGNPTSLVPLYPAEEAERMAELAGGTDKLLAAAQKALAGQDYRWAARLADYLLRLGEAAAGGRIKADALEALGREILPMSGKNYLARSAMDLRR